MKQLLAPLAVLLFSALAVLADEPVVKTWDYADLGDTPFSASNGNTAARRTSPEVKPPGQRAALAVTLTTLNPAANAWDVQLSFLYLGGLKAWREYEISFLCKSSVPGTIRLAAAQAGRPHEELPGANLVVDVSDDWRPVTLTFTAKRDWTEPLALPRLMFAKYGRPATVYLGPVTLRELPKRLPLSLNREWSLFLNAEAPAAGAVLPKELPGPGSMVKPRIVTLNDDRLDLAALAGGFRDKQCAILYNQFDSPAAGKMRVGLAADWWFELQVNGEPVYSTIPGGNGSNSFTTADHVVEFPVKAGRNLLAAKVLSGACGWLFVCGPATRAPNGDYLLTIRPGPDWKAVDLTKLQVKSGTALDLSALAGARRPAGTFGRLIANPNGRLAYEQAPATPVRLFGFNAWGAYGVATWSNDQIKAFAEATARQGYNVMRIQAVDSILSMNRDGYYGLEAELRERTISFNPAALDKLDYLLACLKENGVYFNLDLMSWGTGYTRLHGWLPLGAAGFKTQLLIHPAFRGHWEAAVRQLMNHRNPYTGLCLKDEPALACVEPYNEQEIFLFEKDTMKALTPAYRQYLKDKYRTEAALRQAWGQGDAAFDRVPDITEELLRQGDAMAADAGAFLIKTMSDVTDWYVATLRNCGYPGLITQWDMIMRTLELPVRAKMPAIAQHSYFAHPGWSPTKNLVVKSKTNIGALKDNDISVSQGSSLNSSYMRAAAVVRFLDRPFMMTEYSHSAFNRYRHERGLYFGAYAALQGWDALHCHGLPIMIPEQEGRPFCYVENPQDPISRASEVVTALAWLRGDVREAPHTVQLNLSDKALFPKYFLSAIGDDYAKLAMLSRIGIVYPEITPLAPVGQARADLEFTPEEFSRLGVTAWYVSASSNDGKIFPALLQRLREKRLLPRANQTDFARRIFQSETGEITLNGKEETMTVVTPRLEGAILKQDRPVKLGCLEIVSCTRPASVVVASLDRGQPLADAKRLLLVLATNALNTGMTFENAAMFLMVDVGKTPVLMETARLALTLNSTQCGQPTVYALNLDGTRAEPVPCTFKAGRLTLTLDLNQLKYATPFFEITFP